MIEEEKVTEETIKEEQQEATAWAKATEVSTEELSEDDQKFLDSVIPSTETITEETETTEEDEALSGDEINIFTKPLGTEYSKALSRIFHSEITQRDTLMKDLLEKAEKDETLSQEAKDIVNGIGCAHYAATFADKCSAPMFSFFESKNPNLKKHASSEVRLQRIIDELKYVVSESGFYFNPEILGAVYKINLIKFSYVPKKEDENHVMFYAMVLIGLYSRGLESADYANYWYILMFMKNMCDMAVLSHEQIEKEKSLYELQRTMTKFLVYIWKKSDPDSFVEPLPQVQNTTQVKVSDVSDIPLAQPKIPMPNF